MAQKEARKKVSGSDLNEKALAQNHDLEEGAGRTYAPAAIDAYLRKMELKKCSCENYILLVEMLQLLRPCSYTDGEDELLRNYSYM